MGGEKKISNKQECENRQTRPLEGRGGQKGQNWYRKEESLLNEIRKENRGGVRKKTGDKKRGKLMLETVFFFSQGTRTLQELRRAR